MKIEELVHWLVGKKVQILADSLVHSKVESKVLKLVRHLVDLWVLL